MSHPRALVVLLALALTLLAGCELVSVNEQQAVFNAQTQAALTPTITPTPTSTPTATVTATPTATAGPSPTPTMTPMPSVTPLPPTPTPDPALQGFSLCTQVAGNPDVGRFSAQLTSISVTNELNYDRISLTFALPDATGALSPTGIVASARCLTSADAAALSRTVPVTSPFVLHVGLDGWLRDTAFASSTRSETLPVSGTDLLTAVGIQVDPDAPAGATLVVPLPDALPFRLGVAQDGRRLDIDIARRPQRSAGSDLLSVAAGGGAPATLADLFAIRDGELVTIRASRVVTMTDDVGVVTDLAVNADASRIAFCRAEPGADPEDPLGAPSTLVLIDADGSNQTELARVGRACIDPAFSADGSQVIFSVDETGARPAQLALYRVPVAGGPPELLVPRDAWSRFGAAALADGSLVYAAVAEDGRSTLFRRDPDGTERDIGADLLRGTEFIRIGPPQVARDGARLAVEVERRTGGGAVLLLAADGTLLETINPELDDAYYTRVLAWDGAGRLYLLSTACEAEAVQDYTVWSWDGRGRPRALGTGSTLGAVGPAVGLDEGLAYVVQARHPPRPRRPLVVDPRQGSALWVWDLSSNRRGQVIRQDVLISALAR